MAKRKRIRMVIPAITRRRQAYEIAEYAIGQLSNVSAQLEEFDQMLEGSSITEALNAEVDRCEKRMKKVLEDGYKLLERLPMN